MLIQFIPRFVSPFALRSLPQSLSDLNSLLLKKTQMLEEGLPTAMHAKES